MLSIEIIFFIAGLDSSSRGLGRVKLTGQLNYSRSVKCREEKTLVIEHNGGGDGCRRSDWNWWRLKRNDKR